MAECALAFVNLVREVGDASLEGRAGCFVCAVVLVTQAIEHLHGFGLLVLQLDVLLVERTCGVAAEVREAGIGDVVIQDKEDRVRRGV